MSLSSRALGCDCRGPSRRSSGPRPGDRSRSRGLAPHAIRRDRTKICRANSIFLPTCSTICRQAPLFADKIHYLPTQASICRHRQLFADTGNYSPTKTSIFCRHVPNAPTFATLRNVSFSLSGTPLPTPPPTFGAPSRSASPAARPWILPAHKPCHN